MPQHITADGGCVELAALNLTAVVLPRYFHFCPVRIGHRPQVRRRGLTMQGVVLCDRPDALHRIPRRAAHECEVEVLIEDAAERQPVPPAHRRQTAGEDAVEWSTALGCVAPLSKVAQSVDEDEAHVGRCAGKPIVWNSLAARAACATSSGRRRTRALRPLADQGPLAPKHGSNRTKD